MSQSDKNPQPIAEVGEESAERTEMSDGSSDESLSGGAIGNAVESHPDGTGSANAATTGAVGFDKSLTGAVGGVDAVPAGAVGGFDESLTGATGRTDAATTGAVGFDKSLTGAVGGVGSFEELLTHIGGVDAVPAGAVGGLVDSPLGAIIDTFSYEIENPVSDAIQSCEYETLAVEESSDYLRKIGSQRNQLIEQEDDILGHIKVMKDLIRTYPESKENPKLEKRIDKCYGFLAETLSAIAELDSKEKNIRSQLREIQKDRLQGNLGGSNFHAITVKGSNVKVQTADRPSRAREGGYGSDDEEDTSVKRDVDEKNYGNRMTEAARVRLEETEGAAGLAVAEEEAEKENANEEREEDEGRLTYILQLLGVIPVLT